MEGEPRDKTALRPIQTVDSVVLALYLVRTQHGSTPSPPSSLPSMAPPPARGLAVDPHHVDLTEDPGCPNLCTRRIGWGGSVVRVECLKPGCDICKRCDKRQPAVGCGSNGAQACSKAEQMLAMMSLSGQRPGPPPPHPPPPPSPRPSRPPPPPVPAPPPPPLPAPPTPGFPNFESMLLKTETAARSSALAESRPIAAPDLEAWGSAAPPAARADPASWRPGAQGLPGGDFAGTARQREWPAYLSDETARSPTVRGSAVPSALAFARRSSPPPAPFGSAPLLNLSPDETMISGLLLVLAIVLVLGRKQPPGVPTAVSDAEDDGDGSCEEYMEGVVDDTAEVEVAAPPPRRAVKKGGGARQSAAGAAFRRAMNPWSGMYNSLPAANGDSHSSDSSADELPARRPRADGKAVRSAAIVPKATRTRDRRQCDAALRHDMDVGDCEQRVPRRINQKPARAQAQKPRGRR